MRKEIRPNKLRDMVRSILPSRYRVGPRQEKALRKRAHRRMIRAELGHEDAEVTAADFLRDVRVSDIVQWRRGGDKLAHFMRWCEKITAGMAVDEALGFVRSILPKSLIGDHAYGHWESHRRYLDERQRYTRFWQRGERRVQSFVDSTMFRLRRVLVVDPGLHARLNEAIKARKSPDEPRRLLAGLHDVEAFVRAIARPLQHEAQYWRDATDPHVVERSTTLALIEQVEKTKGGRKAALRVSGSVVLMRTATPAFAAGDYPRSILLARHHRDDVARSDSRLGVIRRLFLIVIIQVDGRFLTVCPSKVRFISR